MEEEQEVWRDVVGYESVYKVSNLGRVKSLDRVMYHGGVRRGSVLAYKYNWGGYARVILSRKYSQKNFCVHRLVADAFIVNPNNKTQVNHINEIRDDNRACNLEWTNRRENINYSSNKKSSSKYSGVSYSREGSNWYACICVNNKRTSIGYYEDEKECARSYVQYCLDNNIEYDFKEEYLKEIEYKQ